LPHLEQRIRSASPLRVTDQPDEARQGFRVDLTARAAVTDHTHWELTEGIVQFPDVGRHAYARMVLTEAGASMQCWARRPYWMRARHQGVLNDRPVCEARRGLESGWNQLRQTCDLRECDGQRIGTSSSCRSFGSD
jgi:hypothetical protein